MCFFLFCFVFFFFVVVVVVFWQFTEKRFYDCLFAYLENLASSSKLKLTFKGKEKFLQTKKNYFFNN